MRAAAVGAQVDRATDHEQGELVLVRLGGFAAAHHLPTADDGDPVRYLEDLVELVADENHARAFGAQSPEHLEDLVRLLRRQHGGRFVENEDPRVPVDRLQDLDALLLTNRQLIDAARGIDVESKLSGQQLDPLCGLPEVQKLAPANDLVPEHHVLRDGEDWDEHEVLVDHADPTSDRIRGIADRDRLAVDEDLAGVRCDESVEDVHERRLPGAVLAEERVDLAA